MAESVVGAAVAICYFTIRNCAAIDDASRLSRDDYNGAMVVILTWHAAVRNHHNNAIS